MRHASLSLATFVLAVFVVACSGHGSSQSSGTASGGANSGPSTTGTGSNTGGGGSGTASSMNSTGAFGTSSATTGSGCAGQITCAMKGYDCGKVGDGCGGILDCGTCTKAGDSCGGDGMPNVCGQKPCTPKTCTGLGYDCGMTSDGCNGTLDCGACPTGKICGSMSANKCGGSMCTPKTCAQLGFDCGMQGDGCGNAINCGSTCPTGQTCGGGGVSGVCGAPICPAKTCAQQGFNCGMATDGCNNIINCGACPGGQTCGGGGPNVCGNGSPCTGLCLQQQTCPSGGTTSISGTVFAPQGTDPLPNTLVYVPNAAVQPFAPGVHCGQCGADVSGSPLVSAVTGVDGTFKITNMPVGQNIPLVIQNGRWRRQFVIPKVTACTNTALPTTGAAQLRMPQTKAEGDIPLMGFVTGSVDALECVLRKIGIADSEFSDPTGNGRVRFYKGNDAPGATYSATTPTEATLWGSQATINQYDMVYFACQGGDYEKTAAQQQIVVNYANAGGRVFTTHYSYVWLTNTADNAVWSPTAQWTLAEGFFANDPGTGLINTAASNPSPTTLAKWLQLIGASTTYGQMPINTLRQDFAGVNAPSLLWISVNDQSNNPFTPGLGDVPLHYTFDTPWGTAPANQCGRVLYSDFHVEDAATGGTTFPSECAAGAMTPQEKMLEFMIFDLGSCVTPPMGCVPRTCAQAGAACGPIGDGCGNILQCGMCPAGESCVNGACVGCTAKTCAAQGFKCGMQGDGCGNIENCGPCPAGQNCVNGMCQTGTCTGKTCTQEGFNCGAQGDGCGNVIQCGTCANNQTCTAGMCTTPSCIPKTCAQQGFNCGAASDGCNNILQCGTCAAGQTCGGGTPPQANVCGGGAA